MDAHTGVMVRVVRVGPHKPAPIALAVTGIEQPPDAALQRRLPRGDKLLGTVYFDTAHLE